MKKNLSSFLFHLTYGFICLLSFLPFGALYILADILAWLACDVVRYRRRVVHENLTSSFPEKGEGEIRAIEKGFYRFLADYFFETVKLATMSAETMRRRLRVEGIELVNEAVADGKSVTIYLGHYCNWEWVSSLPLHIDSRARCAQIYHPLENSVFDRVFYRLRTRFGANNIAMADIMQRLVAWKRAGVPSVTGYIADQAPGMNIHLFLDFLNHETGVYTGPERISKFLDARVVYAHMSRPKRGYYVLRFLPVADAAKREPMFEISKSYFSLLEENIRQAPQYWLWSHRRWKRTRAMFETYHGDNAPRMLTHL